MILFVKRGSEMCGGQDYNKLLQEGLEFQDFITDRLYDIGIILLDYKSRKYSLKKENKMGVEIKLDNRFRETGNLYIETAERVRTDQNFLPSGIHRDNNTWLLLIGDTKTVWIFSTKQLRMFEKKCRCVETPTSKGFLVPITRAESWCVQRIDFYDTNFEIS